MSGNIDTQELIFFNIKDLQEFITENFKEDEENKIIKLVIETEKG